MSHRLALVAVALVAFVGSLAAPATAHAAPATSAKPAATKAATTVTLVGGTVHVGDGTTIENARIEIRGERIVSVSASKGGPSTPGEIDLAGKIVTPGFIAADAAVGLVEIGAEDSTVDTSPEDADPVRAAYDVSSAVNARSTLIAVQAIDGVTSAAVTPHGGLISGQVAWIDMLEGADRRIVAKPRIAMRASVGAVIAGSRAATLSKLAEVFADASFYASRSAAFDRRDLRDLSAHRLDLEALQPVLAGKSRLIVRADRVSDILAIIDFAKERKLALTLVSGAQALAAADELAAAGIPVIVKPSANIPHGFDRIGQGFDLAAKLHAAGVTVAIATLDEPHNLRNVKQEAGIAIANGLPRDAALMAVTSAVAKAYGMEADYGSVGAGKVANLVVWDADPFELSSVPTAVYVRGRAIPLVSRQTKLRDRYLRRSTTR